MSKFDPTGESLESILASIRRSLAEQSTDALADDAAPAPAALDILGAVVPGEDPPPRFLGNGGAAAPHPSEVPLPAEAPLPADRAFAGLDDPPPPASISAVLSRLDEPTQPVPMPTAPAPQPDEAPKDPLWFLTRPGGKDTQDDILAPAASVAAPTQPAPAGIAEPLAAAPKLALREIVRGPLPPFFGSSPEAAKVEVIPTPLLPGQVPGAAVIPPAAPRPAPVPRPADREPPRTAALDSAPAGPAGAVGPDTSTAAPAREAAPGGKVNAVPSQPTVDGAAPPAAGPTQLQGLEAMVAELLRPMLRRWLDENMPRLVSAALEAEAENLSKRDPKKP